MSTPHDPLADPDLLARMSPSLVALARRGERRLFRRHETLIREGEYTDTLFIVLSGRVQPYSVSENGREFIFNTYDAGEYVGEMSLDGGPRSTNVRALETTLTSMITRPVLASHLDADPAFAFELLAKVIRRARAATISARQLAFNKAYGQLKTLLEALAKPLPDGRLVVPERLTQQEIANRCGCAREMISRLMKELQPHYLHIGDEGLIELLRVPLPAKF